MQLISSAVRSSAFNHLSESKLSINGPALGNSPFGNRGPRPPPPPPPICDHPSISPIHNNPIPLNYTAKNLTTSLLTCSKKNQAFCFPKLAIKGFFRYQVHTYTQIYIYVYICIGY
ncbi:hypothetical protein Hanom_Chr06g00493881 [Helianthus anomalus]